MADKRLESMRSELKLMAIAEAMKLWRIARKAQAHGVSNELVQSIREEADIMYNTMTSYPDRLLDWKFQYDYKYAFHF